jgi:hypothetical protein
MPNMNPKIKEIPWALHFIILTQTISELDDEMCFFHGNPRHFMVKTSKNSIVS